MRTIGASALAFGAVLLLNGAASAGDDTPGNAWNSTVTLGGQGTVADATTEDIESTGYYGGYRGGYGGYRGGYGGGYRGGYGGGYRGGYGGGYGGYRGGYYGGGYRGYYGGYRGGYGYGLGLAWNRPWGYGGFNRPYYSGYYGGYGYSSYGYSSYGYGGYGYCGISGSTEDAEAPVVTLNMAVANNPFTPRERSAGAAAPADTNLPVSLTKPTSPYTYKAYGEK